MFTHLHYRLSLFNVRFPPVAIILGGSMAHTLFLCCTESRYLLKHDDEKRPGAKSFPRAGIEEQAKLKLILSMHLFYFPCCMGHSTLLEGGEGTV